MTNEQRDPGELGLFFFSGLEAPAATTYRTVLEAARIADRSGLTFVSTPERHFHQFGGAFPNPAVLSAAIATVTDRVQIRAGSLITPLHPTVRILEDWSLLDVLSAGRAALSVGCGWNANDFVIAPQRYENRQQELGVDIEALRAAWRTGVWRGMTPAGQVTDVAVFPRPIQAELPIWTSAARSIDTFRAAGRLGTNVLTHLELQEVHQLAEKIDAYRTNYRADHDGDGTVTLMMHTYVGTTAQQAEEVGSAGLTRYLGTAIDLGAGSVRAGGRMTGGRPGSRLLDISAARPRLAAVGGRRLLDGRSLIGDTEHCAAVAQSVFDVGVDEIGCLVDIVGDPAEMLAGVGRLGAVRDALHRRPATADCWLRAA